MKREEILEEIYYKLDLGKIEYCYLGTIIRLGDTVRMADSGKAVCCSNCTIFKSIDKTVAKILAKTPKPWKAFVAVFEGDYIIWGVL